jgi:hypothetical protein
MSTNKTSNLVQHTVALDIAVLGDRRYLLDLSMDPVTLLVHRFNVRLDQAPDRDVVVPS